MAADHNLAGDEPPAFAPVEGVSLDAPPIEGLYCSTGASASTGSSGVVRGIGGQVMSTTTYFTTSSLRKKRNGRKDGNNGFF